jgi:chemotaxis protein CheX
MGMDRTVLGEVGITEDAVRATIVEIAKGVFSTMAMLDVVGKEPLAEPVKKFYGTMTGMVGFAGSYSGILAVHCPRDLSLHIASNMLGTEVAEMNNDVSDAMGEIANMIGGDVKHIFSPGGGDISLSIPTVISGDEYSISSSDSMAIPFECGKDSFLISIKVRK